MSPTGQKGTQLLALKTGSRLKMTAACQGHSARRRWHREQSPGLPVAGRALPTVPAGEGAADKGRVPVPSLPVLSPGSWAHTALHTPLPLPSLPFPPSLHGRHLLQEAFRGRCETTASHWLPSAPSPLRHSVSPVLVDNARILKGSRASSAAPVSPGAQAGESAVSPRAGACVSRGLASSSARPNGSASCSVRARPRCPRCVPVRGCSTRPASHHHVRGLQSITTSESSTGAKGSQPFPRPHGNASLPSGTPVLGGYDCPPGVSWAG